MKLIDWRPFAKNTLKGFASVELPNGLVILDSPVHLSHGKAWASLPSKPQVNTDGTVRRDNNGKTLYVPILKWRNDTLRDGFSRAVVQVVEAAHGVLK